MNSSAAAVAHPNIAFIKYWGNRDDRLRLPANGSLSMNLAGLITTTRVRFRRGLEADQVELNGSPLIGPGLDRVSGFLDLIREMSGVETPAEVVSENNFPTGAGIASSASGFAALALAGSYAAGLTLSEETLSRLARRGSGSASRSVPGGFVEWQAGEGDRDSYAFTIAGPDHWRLADCVAVVSEGHKAVGSTGGHPLAGTSPIQEARVADAPRRLALCREAVLSRDFETFAQVVEQDNHLMHAVMMTSEPPLFYWVPATLKVILAVQRWREEDGLSVCSTIDAGPNVHVICPEEQVGEVSKRLRALEGVNKVLESAVGGGAYLLPPEPDRV